MLKLKLVVSIFTAAALMAQSTPPTSVPGTTTVSALPGILNNNFTNQYSGVGAYGTSFPATCSPGQKYTFRWTGVSDQEYRCITPNVWRPYSTLLSVSGQAAVHVNPSNYVVPLTVGDNIVATCPTGKWCNTATGTANTINDGSSVQYSTGTLTLTNGSTVVVGVGTTFTSGMSPSRIRVSGVDIYVSAFASSTSLTLASPWGGATASGLSYVLNYGSVSMGQYIIHNGVRYEQNTGFQAPVPPGIVNTSCCISTSIHLDPGDSLGYTVSGVGVTVAMNMSVSDPVPFSRSISNWNITVGSPQVVYTCPVGYVCTIQRAAPTQLGSLSTQGGYYLWYQGGPATANIETHIVAGGGSTITPASFAQTSHQMTTKQFAAGMSTSRSMSGGDTLVVWCQDPTVTGLVLIAAVTETPVTEP